MILTGATEVLGEKHYTAWVVHDWMSMEHWWNDTDRGNWSAGRKTLYSVGGRWMNMEHWCNATKGTQACDRPIWPRIRECEVWCFLECDASESVGSLPAFRSDLFSVTSPEAVFTRCMVVHRMCVFDGNIVMIGQNRNYMLMSSEIVLIPSKVTWPWKYETVQ